MKFLSSTLLSINDITALMPQLVSLFIGQNSVVLPCLFVRKSNGLGQWSSALEIKTGGPSMVKNATMISYDADICCKELKWSNL